jgi:hypothetical protein
MQMDFNKTFGLFCKKKIPHEKYSMEGKSGTVFIAIAIIHLK